MRINRNLLVLSFFILLCHYRAFSQDEGLVVHEISNGSSGTKEFIELLVVGCPGGGTTDTKDPKTLDLRGWIIDDNNGDFSNGASASEGISDGHIRLSTSTVWASVPVGSIIVIYNAADKNTNLPGDDPSDLNNDLVYVIAIDAKDDSGVALFKKCTTLPTSANDSYPASSADGCYVDADATAWNVLELRDIGDGIQTRKPDAVTRFHGLSYGTAGSNVDGQPFFGAGSGVNSVHIVGDGTGKAAFFNNNLNYRTSGNYVLTAASSETPGLVNTATNGLIVAQFKSPTSAGDDQIVCGQTLNLPGNGVKAAWGPANMWTFSLTGQWTTTQKPTGATVSFSDPTISNSIVSVSVEGPYVFRWQQTATAPTGGTACSDGDEVSVYFTTAFAANAGTNFATCDPATTLNANITGTATGKWTVVDPASAAVVFGDDTSPTSTVTFPSSGTYKLRWTLQRVINELGLSTTCTSSDDITIVYFDAQAQVTKPTERVCGTSITLDGNTPATGQTGVWTVTDAGGNDVTGTVTFSPDANTATATATVAAGVPVDAGTQRNFVWTVTAGPELGLTCSESATKQVFFYSPPTNNPMTAQTGICGGRNNTWSTTLTGTALSGTRTNLSGEWSYVSGPDASPVFSNVNQNSTTVTVTQKGSYQFKWSIFVLEGSEKVCEVAQIVDIEFIDFPAVNAGKDQYPCGLTLPATITMAASPTTGVWSVIQQPAGATTVFSNTASATSTVTLDVPGTYQLVWTRDVGTICENSDTMKVLLTQQVTVTGITANPVSPVCGLSTTLETTSTPAIPEGQWVVSPSNGVTIADPTNYQTVVTVTDAGDYTFTWTAGQGACASSKDITVNFSAPITNPTISPGITMFRGLSTQLEASGGLTYSWSPSSGLSDTTIANPVASPDSTTLYKVTIRSGTCEQVLEVLVKIIIDLQVPNAFTPNGDGVNDTWEIPVLSTISDIDVKVFNRWGNAVFKSDNYNTPWDGKFNGKDVGTGTFYYVIRLNSFDQTFKGVITIVR